MKGFGRAAGAIVLLLVLATGLALLFNSMRAAREQTVAAPPTPSPLGPTLVLSPPTPGQTPTLPPVPPILTPTPSPTPFPAPTGPPPTVEPSRYISREVVAAGIGSGPGEIGIKIYGNMPEGPKALALDNAGNIYIADNGNQRVNKYGPEGKFEASIALPDKVAPWDLAVDGKGDMYVLDRATSHVLKFTPEGALTRRYSAPRGIDGEAIRLLPNGTLAIQGTSAEVSRLGTPEREFTPEEKGATELGFLYRDGVFQPGKFRRSPDGRWGILENILAGGKQLTLTVSLPEAIPGPIGTSGAEKPGEGTVGFHDIDAQGNYYVDASMVHGGVPLKVDEWILRYDVTGQLKAFLPLRPPVPYTYPSAFASFRVAPDGDVYVLQPFKDQVKVVRWEYRP